MLYGRGRLFEMLDRDSIIWLQIATLLWIVFLCRLDFPERSFKHSVYENGRIRYSILTVHCAIIVSCLAVQANRRITTSPALPSAWWNRPSARSGTDRRSRPRTLARIRQRSRWGNSAALRAARPGRRRCRPQNEKLSLGKRRRPAGARHRQAATSILRYRR